MLKETKASLKRKIGILKIEADNLRAKNEADARNWEQEKTTLKTQHEEDIKNKDSYIKAVEEKFNRNRKSLGQEVENLKKDLVDKQKQIDKRELKKFAEAYEMQEIRFEKEYGKWFWYVITAFIIVVITILVIVLLAKDVSLSEKIGYYLIDIILITFLVFSLKQYSYYIKLSTDYGNRKTLAQSYFNIINTAEDEVIKDKFLDKMSDVITAKAEVEDESYTIPEKILESITEIAKNLSKK